MSIQAKLLCTVAVSAFAAFAAVAPAQALSPQECSAKYLAAKTAGTLNDQKWNDFRKAECGADATAASVSLRAQSDPFPVITEGAAHAGMSKEEFSQGLKAPDGSPSWCRAFGGWIQVGLKRPV
jgi:hypothetical protein